MLSVHIQLHNSVVSLAAAVGCIYMLLQDIKSTEGLESPLHYIDLPVVEVRV